MNFDYDKQQIRQIAAEHSYTATNVEKVLRLCMILNDLNEYEEFAGNLLLKGGTAINLVAFGKLPRLSVDLDLDFAHNISKEETDRERKRINNALSDYSKKLNYEISDRSSFVLDSKSLTYHTTTGSIDKIKLDINYHSRCHVYPPIVSNVSLPFDKDNRKIRVAHLDVIELFAGKIKAYYERYKPRDIFDIYTLSHSDLLKEQSERDKLRKCAVFYSVLGNADRPDLLETTFDSIRKMPFYVIKTQLLPMLHTKLGHFDKDKLIGETIDFMQSLMVLDETEKEFIKKFFQGHFCPELLFDENISYNLQRHPVILRTLQMVENKK